MDLHQIDTKLPYVGFGESRIGGRRENQDTYGYETTPFGLLVTVCDGMGGGPGGKTASSIAVSEIIEGVVNASEDETATNALLKAIHRANLAILEAAKENPDLQGMGTTCTALLINNKSAVIAHVGDSRVYQLRGRHKVFRTFDHSMVFELVKQKVINEEQARCSEQSNIITRALGLKPELEIDVVERAYEKGDRFMLCTDGIHGTMPETELIQRVANHNNLGQVVDGLATYVDYLGRSHGGGHDNLTIVIIETKTKSTLNEKMSTRNKIILVGIAALLLASFILNMSQCSRNKNSGKLEVNYESLSKAIQKGDTSFAGPNGDTIIIEIKSKN